MDERIATRSRRKKRRRVRRDPTSDEEATTKLMTPSTSKAAKSVVVKCSPESSSAESDINGIDPESKSLASYVEAVHNAYETAQEIVEEREKESNKELIRKTAEEHHEELLKYPRYVMPLDETKNFRIDSDSENDENEENFVENPKKEMAPFRYWANKRWKGKIAECPVYTLPTTKALPRSTDFGFTHINVLRDDRSVLAYIPYFTDQNRNSNNEKKLMHLMHQLYYVGAKDDRNIGYINNRYLIEMLRILVEGERAESGRRGQGSDPSAATSSANSAPLELTAEKIEELPAEYFEAFARLKPVWGNAEQIKERALRIVDEFNRKNLPAESAQEKDEMIEEYSKLAAKMNNAMCYRCFQFGCLRHQSDKEKSEFERNVGRYAAAMAAKDGEDIETWSSPRKSPTAGGSIGKGTGGTIGKGKRRSSTNRDSGKDRKLRRNRMSAYKMANDSVTKGKRAGHLQPYVPCNHPAVDCFSADAEICGCKRAGTLCEKYCSCAHYSDVKCSIRFTYCTCSMGKCSTKLCPCFAAKRECDPDHCVSCGAVPQTVAAIYNADPQQTAICKNVAIQRRLWKKVSKDVSLIPGAGYGCFAGETIKAGELVEEYTGEIISDAEANRRGLLADRRHYSYIFNLNARFSIDALKLGSMIRFANDQSGRKANCQPRIMLVNGDHRIGIYAVRDIAVGEELTFDYSYDSEMQCNHFDGDMRSRSSNSRKRKIAKVSRRRQSASTPSDESAQRGSRSASLDNMSVGSQDF